MAHKKTLLRLVFWFGMIADTFEVLRMAVPKLFILSTGTNLTDNPELRQGLLYGAPVMLGWTLILFWANRKPLERKGVLLSLIPVIIGYIIVQSVGVASGAYPIARVVPSFSAQAILLSLSIIVSVQSGRTKASER
jgi:hypothetical protein